MPCAHTSALFSACGKLSHAAHYHRKSKICNSPQLLFHKQTASKVQRGHTSRRSCPSLRLSVCACSEQDERSPEQDERNMQGEQSDLAHSEIIYFMFQMVSSQTLAAKLSQRLSSSRPAHWTAILLKTSTQKSAALLQNLDMQLQRALNMDDFETAQDIRTRREQIDQVVAQQLVCASSLLPGITPDLLNMCQRLLEVQINMSFVLLPTCSMALYMLPVALQPAALQQIQNWCVPAFSGHRQDCAQSLCQRTPSMCWHAKLRIKISTCCQYSGLAQPLCHNILHLTALFQESKGSGCGSRAANQTAVADLASEGLRLRSELQRAIDEERYADAAQMRDRIKAVQV